MKKYSHIQFRCLFIFVLLMSLNRGLLFSQSNPSYPTSSLPPEKIEEYKEEAKQLVSFVEFLFNTLGGTNTTPKEKETIITQSYLKAFRDAEVQIEDDLVENRAVVTNKDIQAYLKDIDFFFTNVQFDFLIDEITHNVNEDNQIYFTVKTSRNLSGYTLDKQSVNRNQDRYFEINLDDVNRDLKIVSMYTTKLSLEEDLSIWWNELPFEWKYLYGKDIMVSNKLTMTDILNMEPEANIGDTILIRNFDSFYSSDSGLVGDLSMLDPRNRVYKPRIMDTLILKQASIFDHLKKITSLETLDLSDHLLMHDLSGLTKLTDLKSLNISNTQVSNLVPLRNLTKLEALNISNTKVTSLDPLRYALELKTLICDQTPIINLTTLTYFQRLEKLSINKTNIRDVSVLGKLTKLTDVSLDETAVLDIFPLGQLSELTSLSIAKTQINSIQPLSGLNKLQQCNIEYTPVEDLGPLSNDSSLQLLFCDWSKVSSLQPLINAPDLKRIYCDNTKVSAEDAMAFMQSRPEVLVIYESAILQKWWERLPEYWRTIFKKYADIPQEPNREELHEIINISEIDIQNNSEIISLDPLSSLINLRKLKCDFTKIYSLEPLRYLLKLEDISFTYTQVENVEPISKLPNLKRINASHTLLTDIAPLQTLGSLEYINLDNTNIFDITPLKQIENLQFIYADNSKVTVESIGPLISDALIVFRTNALQAWWSSLPAHWQQVFQEYVPVSEIPTREELHQITSQRILEIKGVSQIKDLTPLQQILGLTELHIENTPIQNLAPIKDLTQLISLKCIRSPISDLEPISNLNNLTYLNIENTPVSDLSSVSSLINLISLRCSGTQIRDLKALKNLSKLESLDISITDVKSLNDINDLTNLKNLICFNTRLSSSKVDKFKSKHPQVEVVYY